MNFRILRIFFSFLILFKIISSTVHSDIFSQTLLDFEKSISGPIELKFSGKTLNAILYPNFFLVVYFVK